MSLAKLNKVISQCDKICGMGPSLTFVHSLKNPVVFCLEQTQTHPMTYPHNFLRHSMLLRSNREFPRIQVFIIIAIVLYPTFYFYMIF